MGEKVEVERVLKETYLSRKPATSARLAMALGLAALCFPSVAYWRGLAGVDRSWLATPELVFSTQQYLRLFTTILIHSDFGHLAGNALSFCLLSFLLNGYFGFWIFPVLSFVAGMLINAVVLATFPPEMGLLGASGVVYWMAGFWITLYLFTDRRYSVVTRLVRALGFSLVMLVPTSFEPNVSYRAHAVGLALGILAGALYFAKHRARLRNAERYELDYLID